MLYLDNAATTPVRPEVLEAMAPYLGHAFGNPSSHHTVGEHAASALEDARARVASALGYRVGDIVFTSGGTEANNLAVKGIALSAGQASGKRHIITTAIEHESVLQSAHYLERFHGFAVTVLEVDRFGLLDLDRLANALRADTALISLAHANNEIGTVQDISAAAVAARAEGVASHVDAVQSAGWLPLHDLGADALSLSGHKLGAPKGTGVLAIRGRIPLEPLIHGGGQERGRRSGTENVAGAVGLACALELAERERQEASDRLTRFRDAFIAGVLDAVPAARLTGHPTRRLPGTASFTFGGVSGEAVLLELERRGIVSSSGSACAAGSDEASHVLVACGIAPEIAQTSVRFTFGRGKTPDAAMLAAQVAASVAAVSGQTDPP